MFQGEGPEVWAPAAFRYAGVTNYLTPRLCRTSCMPQAMAASLQISSAYPGLTVRIRSCSRKAACAYTHPSSAGCCASLMSQNGSEEL